TPGLKPWSRFVFLQGILAYIAPGFWLAFLAASITAPLFAPPIDYFPIEYWPFPVIPVSQVSKALGLAIGIGGLLFLPKLLILLDAACRGRTGGFGGVALATRSTLTELLLSSLTAPIFLMFQTRSVLQVLRGADGGWPAQVRGDGTLSLGDAWAASNWIVATGTVVLVAAQGLSPQLVPWLLPVALPMVLSPVIISWSSRPSHSTLFQIGTEREPAPVMRLHDRVMARWTEAEQDRMAAA
ncbi:MAG: hypothetical protein RIT14_1772, partial [Pseudomonadota bacterium]